MANKRVTVAARIDKKLKELFSIHERGSKGLLFSFKFGGDTRLLGEEANRLVDSGHMSVHDSRDSQGVLCTRVIRADGREFKNHAFVHDAKSDFFWNLFCGFISAQSESAFDVPEERVGVTVVADYTPFLATLFYAVVVSERDTEYSEVYGLNLEVFRFEIYRVAVYTSYLNAQSPIRSANLFFSTSAELIDGVPVDDRPRLHLGSMDRTFFDLQLKIALEHFAALHLAELRRSPATRKMIDARPDFITDFSKMPFYRIDSFTGELVVCMDKDVGATPGLRERIVAYTNKLVSLVEKLREKNSAVG